MQKRLFICSPVSKTRFTTGLAVFTLLLMPLVGNSVSADSGFSEKAIAEIQSCDTSEVLGFATLKERTTSEGVKQIDVYMQVDGLSFGDHAVHIYETASCVPCGSAGGHFDPGNFGMTNPDANHPFHSGDLININSDGDKGLMTTMTTRITLSPGPLSLFDADGSAFIVHDFEDSYCPDGEAAGCAGGSRAACGIINKVNTIDDLELVVSPKDKRKNPVELADAELEKDVFIFLSPKYPADSIRKVTYYLNGHAYETETYPPYDFAGTKSKDKAEKFKTNKELAGGTHTIAAEIELSSGQSTFVSSSFTVDNDKDRFANGRENNSNN